MLPCPSDLPGLPLSCPISTAITAIWRNPAHPQGGLGQSRKPAESPSSSPSFSFSRDKSQNSLLTDPSFPWLFDSHFPLSFVHRLQGSMARLSSGATETQPPQAHAVTSSLRLSAEGPTPAPTPKPPAVLSSLPSAPPGTALPAVCLAAEPGWAGQSSGLPH